MDCVTTCIHHGIIVTTPTAKFTEFCSLYWCFEYISRWLCFFLYFMLKCIFALLDIQYIIFLFQEEFSHQGDDCQQLYANRY
ncbi:hypothetical protein CW304_22965 [Bacillus sp. UFRGS-B20]|nr:hypothetical protein CW304_22965 [Bacillus sp. UFRGS-B20]